MQRIIYFILLCASSFLYSQKISDFSYISLSAESKDFSNNKFGLNSLLSSKLKAKGYEILGADIASWPAEAATNPCNVMQADLENTSSFLKNKLNVTFRDCNNKPIASFEGKSNIKEYDAGYRDALSIASKEIPNSNPNTPTVAASGVRLPAATASTTAKPAETAKPLEPSEPLKQMENAGTPAIQHTVQTFSNGVLNLNRINISSSQFILAAPNNSVPYAIFKESTKKDVYHVQLENNVTSLGYFDNGTIIIEKPNADGTYTREVFARK